MKESLVEISIWIYFSVSFYLVIVLSWGKKCEGANSSQKLSLRIENVFFSSPGTKNFAYSYSLVDGISVINVVAADVALNFDNGFCEKF